MATSYSSSLNSYCNVGPLIFIPGVNNDINSADSSNLLQNYPFTDLDAHIMMYQHLTDGTTRRDGTLLPLNTIDISTNVAALGHFFSSAVSIADGSANDSMLATCGYVKTIESLWAHYPAVCDVDMSDNDLTNVGMVTFGGASALKLESSGNYLVVDGSGIFFNEESSVSISSAFQQSITLDENGSIILLPSSATEGEFAANSYGAKLDPYSLLHANLIFVEPSVSGLTSDCSNSQIKFSITSGKLPSIMTFPCVDISSGNITDTEQFNGQTVLSLAGISFNDQQPLKAGFTYTLLLHNTDASANVYVSNREIFINGGLTLCVQGTPVRFAPQTYMIITVSQAPSSASPNPNPYVVDFKGLNSRVMGVDMS